MGTTQHDTTSCITLTEFFGVLDIVVEMAERITSRHDYENSGEGTHPVAEATSHSLELRPGHADPGQSRIAVMRWKKQDTTAMSKAVTFRES